MQFEDSEYLPGPLIGPVTPPYLDAAVDGLDNDVDVTVTDVATHVSADVFMFIQPSSPKSFRRLPLSLSTRTEALAPEGKMSLILPFTDSNSMRSTFTMSSNSDNNKFTVD